jgi:NADH:ubiquinone oxidoreductase subunit H
MPKRMFALFLFANVLLYVGGPALIWAYLPQNPHIMSVIWSVSISLLLVDTAFGMWMSFPRFRYRI